MQKLTTIQAEKYMRTFSIFVAVVKNNREILFASFILGVILFVSFCHGRNMDVIWRYGQYHLPKEIN
jgi:hypothetical protein